MPVTNYIWDVESDNCLMETDGSNVTQAVYTNEPTQFGDLVSQRRGSTTNCYHFDALGSTRQLSDGIATVTNTNLYDAWGVSVDSSGSTSNPFLFVGAAGYYFDLELGDYYIRSRFYSPRNGRWVCIDPLGVTYVQQLYSYLFNGPNNSIDPSGFGPENPFPEDMKDCRCGVAPRKWLSNEISGLRCKDGKLVVEYNPDKKKYVETAEDCGVKKCLDLHENVHKSHYDKLCQDACKPDCGSGSKDGFAPAFLVPESCTFKSECYAYAASVSCLIAEACELAKERSNAKNKFCLDNLLGMGPIKPGTGVIDDQINNGSGLCRNVDKKLKDMIQNFNNLEVLKAGKQCSKLMPKDKR